MNPHVNYAAVGAFLLAGTAIFVALILWLGDQGDTTPMESYVVRIETEVNGLSNGSTVRFLGVDVGSVTDIRLHREVIPFVEVVIQIREDLIIDETAYATLVVQGVTGIANIDLGSDPDWFNPIQFNQDGLAVIPFRRTGLAAVLAGGGDITSGTQQLLAQLNQMTGPENLVRVQRILTNLEEVTGVIADNRSEIPAMVEDLKSALAQLEALTVELRAATADVPVIAGNLRTTSTSGAARTQKSPRAGAQLATITVDLG